MCELADAYVSNEKKYIQAKDISSRYLMPMQYVEQILNKLRKAGLIKAVRGPNGGYVLAKSPDNMRVGEIIEATEGPISLVDCVSKGKNGNCNNYFTSGCY